MSESQNNYFNYRQPLSEIHQGTFLRKISSKAFTFLHETAPSCVCFSDYNSDIFIKLSVCDSSLIDWNTRVETLLDSVVITLPLNYVLKDERKHYYVIFCVGWMRVYRPESLWCHYNYNWLDLFVQPKTKRLTFPSQRQEYRDCLAQADAILQ